MAVVINQYSSVTRLALYKRRNKEIELTREGKTVGVPWCANESFVISQDELKKIYRAVFGINWRWA